MCPGCFFRVCRRQGRWKIPAYRYDGADVIEGAVSDYVLSEFAPEYAPADVSIPVVNVIAIDYGDADEARVWGSFWVNWRTMRSFARRTALAQFFLH